MTDLETRLLAAGARIDGMPLDAWLAMLDDRARAAAGGVLTDAELELQHRARAKAIAGHPQEIAEEHVAAAEARAAASEAQREAERIAAEEAQAWEEFGASSHAGK